ncbi:Retrovirus-related Pol polyprotein like [Argiope bruennichi]|uniref:Retrovirus-related Pol polyprotein like n=1 Tax=Argiope bruennichi TaxID=94029 RepID=A0A8T0FAJ0_ARGBR|nr:Retrovirus-related Pol polyprotein like [Argiope bruennichi]
MEAGEDERRKSQKELKNQIQVHVKSQVKGIKDHVNSCIEKIEEDVQSIEREIGEVRSEVRSKIETVQERIGNLEKRLSELEDRPNNFLPSPEFSSPNQGTNVVKASQLVVSLRGSAAEVLQEIPSEKLMDLMTIQNSLESRFGDSHLTQFYRTELKTKQQKSGENLQVLAADVERLMSLAYAECPLDVRGSLAAQYFVDAIRDEDTQSCIHVRPIQIQDDTGRKSYDKFESLCSMLEKLLNSRDGEKNIPHRNPNVTCWRCNKKRHLQRECSLGVPEVSAQFRYAVTDFPSQVSQNGVLEETSLVDLKTEAIPVRVLNLNNKPKIVNKGTVVVSCDPVVDIVARTQEFSGAHPPTILESLEGLDEQQQSDRDHVLYRKWESDDGTSCRWQLILPKSIITEVLRETHDSPSGGHFGVMKTLTRKGPKTRTKGHLQRYNVGAPFERIALDILGSFPVTTKGNNYALVLMGYFTKWPEAIPIPDQEASTVAGELVRRWISCYDVPMILHSDQGTNFNSALFTELCKLLGIEKIQTTALHPESMVERFNRTILNNLSIFVSKNLSIFVSKNLSIFVSKNLSIFVSNWDAHLPLFLLAYKSAEHEATRLTPAEMRFGRTLRLPCDIFFGRPTEAPSSRNEYVKNLEALLESKHAFASERIKLVSERMTTRYDSRVTDHQFKQAAKIAWSSKSDGQTLTRLSSKLLHSDLKRANHSLHRLSLIVPPPLAR